LFSFSVAEHLAGIETALGELTEAVDRLAAERRRRPGDDLFSHMVAACEDGDRLSMAELVSLVVIMMLGGHDSTRGQFGYAIEVFAAHPEQWALLAERPELAARAVEEVFRVKPSIPIIWRIAAEELTYRDLAVPAGTRLWIMIDAAHGEEGVYGPDSFDISMERAAPLTFGGGPHYCLGAHLARAEMAEALPILARRLPRLQLDGPPVDRPELSGIMGPVSLPIRFSHVST